MMDRPNKKTITTMRTGTDSTYSAQRDDQKKTMSRDRNEKDKNIIERLYPKGEWKQKVRKHEDIENEIKLIQSNIQKRKTNEFKTKKKSQLGEYI